MANGAVTRICNVQIIADTPKSSRRIEFPGSQNVVVIARSIEYTCHKRYNTRRQVHLLNDLSLGIGDVEEISVTPKSRWLDEAGCECSDGTGRQVDLADNSMEALRHAEALSHVQVLPISPQCGWIG